MTKFNGAFKACERLGYTCSVSTKQFPMELNGTRKGVFLSYYSYHRNTFSDCKLVDENTAIRYSHWSDFVSFTLYRVVELILSYT